MARLLYEWDYSQYPGAKSYPHLFKPIQIGNLTVPNRIKYAATEDNFNTHDGLITDADVAYMRERAKGVDAARRGVAAGFDLMEISGIVGYLISNFISSYTNRRTDEYVGDLHTRLPENLEGL